MSYDMIDRFLRNNLGDDDYAEYSSALDSLCAPPAKQEQGEPVAIDGNTSDGYHTFNELYDFRKAYNVALFNEWAAGGKCSVHKSWRHHDGELCFGGGWFIVVAVLPNGQISNHYEAKDWDLFDVQETERALFEFDGHTGSDVIARLKAYTTPPAAPVQPAKQEQGEPVAWMEPDWADGTIFRDSEVNKTTDFFHDHMIPLYTTPQQRKPLTDEKIRSMEFEYIRRRDFARAIEAAHGIKG